jgi:hypothetical protein
MHLVPVKSEAMVREVEEFITAKLEAGWKVPARTVQPYGYPNLTIRRAVCKYPVLADTLSAVSGNLCYPKRSPSSPDLVQAHEGERTPA